MYFKQADIFLYICHVVSKNKIKIYSSLGTKKGREKSCLFIAEGPKVVDDLLQAGFEAEDIFEDIEDIKKISFLQHPQSKLGVFKLRQNHYSLNDVLGLFSTQKLSLALDGIQDPGNMGTIIRIADWFGIENIYCSIDTVDCWSPKVVQATMGSIARVNIYYINLSAFIDKVPNDCPIYTTLLTGCNIYNQKLSQNGIIVMGNEGKGISEELRQKVNKSLYIPNYSLKESSAESLNVAVATAIICAEFRRNRN